MTTGNLFVAKCRDHERSEPWVSATDGEFRLPTQVAVGGGEVFVLDAGNTRIQIFDTAGHFRRAISLVDTDNRSGLAVDSQGDVYVTESVLNQIQVFGHDGQRLYTFDPSTVKSANFTRPPGLWVDARIAFTPVESQQPPEANDRDLRRSSETISIVVAQESCQTRRRSTSCGT